MGASGSGLVEPYGLPEPGPSGATTELGCANPRSTPGSGRLRLAYAGETGGRERLGAIVAPCTDTHAATRSVTAANAAYAAGRRSEEHTSELQSLMRHSYAAFCFKK